MNSLDWLELDSVAHDYKHITTHGVRRKVMILRSAWAREWVGGYSVVWDPLWKEKKRKENDCRPIVYRSYLSKNSDSGPMW